MLRSRFPYVLLILVCCALAQPQRPGTPKDEPARLPDGRSQNEEILKAEHQKSLKDAAELVQLAEDLKAELEKSDRHVLSVGMLKKTEEIEKIAKRIRSRLKRF